VERIRDAFRRVRRVLAVAPTGSGKTATFAYITTNAAAKSRRVYIVAHRQEIVEQISQALDAMGVRHGRIQPGHVMTSDLVQVAMVQTLARRLALVPAPDLLVVDEAHHGTAGTWETVCSAWPAARILGVTATPRRMDGRGLGRAFDEMILGPTMAELIALKFLASYTYLAPPQQVDLSKIKTRMGDFAIDELAAVMDRAVITGDSVVHYRDHLQGRPAIAFCCSVEHAEHVAAQFTAAGYRAASVDGKLDKAERRDRIAAIGDGRLQVLTSCDLISEGVDVPVVAGAILLCPTKSLGKFLQQVGRCLRPKPDGSSAVILDHVGNVQRHGLPDAIRSWSLDDRKKRDVSEPVAVCETCYRAFPVSPGWKAEAECDERPPGCILASAPERKPIATAEGMLEEIQASPDWANGISLTGAKGEEWTRLLRLANSHERLQEIATARAYKSGWVWRMLEMRKGRAEVPWKADRAPTTTAAAALPLPAPATRMDALEEALSL